MSIQDGQMITFDVLNGEPVTYTAMAPDMEGSGTFSGMYAVTGTPNIMVGGDNMVTVATEPVIPVAQVDLSTDKAGADVTITVNATAVNPILGGRDIKVTLEDFGIPSAMTMTT